MNLDPRVVFDTVDLTGVIANAILGGVVARSLKLDAVGFVFLAIITALGGGLLRDTLLNVGQPVALTNPLYLVFALAGAAVAYFVPIRGRWTQRILTVADALSLGCWAATGTAKALSAGLTWLPAMLIGLVTAVGGGMIRDLLVGRIPAVFGGNTLYATGALIGAAEMTIFWHVGLTTWGMGASIVSVAVLTVLARRFGWRLPGPAQWLEDWSPRRLPTLLRRRGSPRGLAEQGLGPATAATAATATEAAAATAPGTAEHNEAVERLGSQRQRLTPARLMRIRGRGGSRQRRG
ncbi:trimeric intracellular cation channel family protein [Galactobacter caseinivorans]|uniref:Trimeric intracellular cation channel family protein n=1 Tax=Galactobacter caseinivorans TaxID=2676123 RepID=A0A496PGE4_9MICC|nr:trimeric intracellular cation channel family protein [Galactobacter caseinivorans]RKW69414.1 trimeric intracellular cation channel family protein [Galactobacter caseinivorans]